MGKKDKAVFKCCTVEYFHRISAERLLFRVSKFVYCRAQIIRAGAYYKIAKCSTALKHFSPIDFILST